jgi:hypothetical protein
LGDVAAVTYQGKTVYAVYGDNHVGNTPHAEISVFTVMALTGVGAVAADTTSLQGVSFVVYKGTHTQLNGSVDQAQIDKIGASSASTGGPGPTCTSTASIDCYKNPLRDQKPLAPARIDEGVDYLAAGPIYALGQGHVDYVNAGSGWPGGTFIGYVLDCGPAQGKRVYVAEHLVNIGVHVGQKVDSNTRLADEVDSSPYDETGWALPASDFNGTPVDLAAAYQIYTPDGTATAYGDNFDDLMVKLGAPHGTYQFSNQSGGKNLTGTLPAGWPKWK